MRKGVRSAVAGIIFASVILWRQQESEGIRRDQKEIAPP